MKSMTASFGRPQTLWRMILAVLIVGSMHHMVPIQPSFAQIYNPSGPVNPISHDFNGDGHPDYIASFPSESRGPLVVSQVRVYSGATRDLLFLLSGAVPNDQFGFSTNSAGDVNGDGFDDIVVGAPGHDFVGWSLGAAYVFSGTDGALLHEIVPLPFSGDSEIYSSFGRSVTGIGDIDDDGNSDFAVSAFIHDSSDDKRGVVNLYSGATGALIGKLEDPLFDTGFGTHVADLGDLNGDGGKDLAVTAPLVPNPDGTLGAVYVFFEDQADYASSYFRGPAAADIAVLNDSLEVLHFGDNVYLGNDLNSDGKAELIIESTVLPDGETELHSEYRAVSTATLLVLNSIVAPLRMLSADTDGDGDVDFDDLVLNVQQFGTDDDPLNPTSADVDGDGDIDGDDIILQTLDLGAQHAIKVLASGLSSATRVYYSNGFEIEDSYFGDRYVPFSDWDGDDTPDVAMADTGDHPYTFGNGGGGIVIPIFGERTIPDCGATFDPTPFTLGSPNSTGNSNSGNCNGPGSDDDDDDGGTAGGGSGENPYEVDPDIPAAINTNIIINNANCPSITLPDGYTSPCYNSVSHYLDEYGTSSLGVLQIFPGDSRRVYTRGSHPDDEHHIVGNIGGYFEVSNPDVIALASGSYGTLCTTANTGGVLVVVGLSPGTSTVYSRAYPGGPICSSFDVEVGGTVSISYELPNIMSYWFYFLDGSSTAGYGSGVDSPYESNQGDIELGGSWQSSLGTDARGFSTLQVQRAARTAWYYYTRNRANRVLHIDLEYANGDPADGVRVLAASRLNVEVAMGETDSSGRVSLLLGADISTVNSILKNLYGDDAVDSNTVQVSGIRDSFIILTGRSSYRHRPTSHGSSFYIFNSQEEFFNSINLLHTTLEQRTTIYGGDTFHSRGMQPDLVQYDIIRDGVTETDDTMHGIASAVAITRPAIIPSEQAHILNALLGPGSIMADLEESHSLDMVTLLPGLRGAEIPGIDELFSAEPYGVMGETQIDRDQFLMYAMARLVELNTQLEQQYPDINHLTIEMPQSAHDIDPVALATAIAEMSIVISLGFVPIVPDAIDLSKELLFEPLFGDEDDEFDELTVGLASVGLLADTGYLIPAAGVAGGAVLNGGIAILKFLARMFPDVFIHGARHAGSLRKFLQNSSDYIYRAYEDLHDVPGGGDIIDAAESATFAAAKVIQQIGRLADSVLSIPDRVAGKVINLVGETSRKFMSDDAVEGIASFIARKGRNADEAAEDLVLEQFEDFHSAIVNGDEALYPVADRSFESIGEAIRKTEYRNHGFNPDTGDPLLPGDLDLDLGSLDRVQEALDASLRGPFTGTSRSWAATRIHPDLAIRSMEEFEVLRFMKGQDLTPAQVDVINTIREGIAVPSNGAGLVKVVDLDTAVSKISGSNGDLTGFFASGGDVAGLNTTKQFNDRLRLDRPTSPILDNSPHVVIETKMTQTIRDQTSIPRQAGYSNGHPGEYIETNPDLIPVYPNTGNGFAASKDGHLTPEWGVGTVAMPAEDTFMKFRHSDGSPYPQTLPIDGVPTTASDWKLVHVIPGDPASPKRWVPLP